MVAGKVARVAKAAKIAEAWAGHRVVGWKDSCYSIGFVGRAAQMVADHYSPSYHRFVDECSSSGIGCLKGDQSKARQEVQQVQTREHCHNIQQDC